MVSQMKPSTCRSCGERVFWVKTKEGKNMPVNGGRVVGDKGAGYGSKLIIDDDGLVYRIMPDQQGELSGFESHFSTCPEAKTWRRPR